MRKVLGFALVLTLVLGVSFAYACGEKSSAKAMKTKADVSRIGSTCGSGAAAAVSTAKAEKAQTVDVEAIDSKANGCGATVQKANISKASSGCRANGSSVKAQKANVQKTDSECDYSKSSDSCRGRSVKESAEKKDTKAPELTKSKSNGMASSVKTLTPEAGSLK